LAGIRPPGGGRGELFDTLLLFENHPTGGLVGPVGTGELVVAGAEERDATHNPLTGWRRPGRRRAVEVPYRTGAAARAHAVGRRLVRALTSIAAATERPVERLELIPDDLRERILRGWAGPPSPPDERLTLVDVFRARAASAPGRVAVAGEAAAGGPASGGGAGTGRAELTYGELDELSDRLARRLVALGAGPETVVALALPRGVDMVVAVLAAWKAGAAYLPVDVSYPPERVALMLADARPAVVVATAETARAIPRDTPGARLLLDAPERGPGGALPGRTVRPEHPAYVIYTSGSTGTPKGVVVTHASVVN